VSPPCVLALGALEVARLDHRAGRRDAGVLTLKLVKEEGLR
jgi:hypothetical protein